MTSRAFTNATKRFRTQSKQPIVINGDMRIAQRGDQTGITAGQYINIDRFFINMINLGTWSFTQSTDTPTGLGFATSLKIDCTTADASPAAGDNFYLSMQSEGRNIQGFEKGTSDAKTYTLAYHIKCNKTGNYVVELWDRTNDRHVAVLKTISAADTWQKVVCNFPADTTGAIASDNARSIMISWAFDTGSDFTSGTLPSAWASRSDANRFVGTTLGLGDSTDNEVLITGVQWEVGTFDSDSIPSFQFEDAETSLARCRRYCFVSGYAGDGGAKCIADFGVGIGSTLVETYMDLKPEMRAAPSMSNSGNINISNGSSAVAATAIAINSTINSRQFAGVRTTCSSGITAGSLYRIEESGSSGAIIILDAEL